MLTYAISEVLIGMGMNSVTLVADGFHNFADAGGFAIAIAANIAQANAHDEAKAEWIGNMGGFANCSVTMLLTCFAGFEAFCRLFVAPHTYEDAHIGPMYFVCAMCGMCINGFGAIFLGGHGHSHGGVPCQSHGSPVPTFDNVYLHPKSQTLKLDPEILRISNGCESLNLRCPFLTNNFNSDLHNTYIRTPSPRCRQG